MRTAAILRELQTQGVIRDEYVPLIYMKLLRNRDSMKAGLYEFKGPVSAVDVMEKLGNKQHAANIIKLTQVLHPGLGGPELKARFLELLARCK